MANRRMFCRDIVNSDAFMDMPASTQLLYFHLGMVADDDGFVGNPRAIQRTVGAADDDYKLLIAKRFVLTFKSGVMVIKHWKMHNYIQSDRYHETKYLEEKKLLVLKENGSYTECIQNVSRMDTEVRLGKVRIGKDTLEGFDEFWQTYPRKVGKPDASKAWMRVVPDRAAIIQGLDAWKKSSEWLKDGGRFIPHPSTFLNQRRWEDKPLEKATPKSFKI